LLSRRNRSRAKPEIKTEIERADGALLEADIPTGAKKRSAYFMVRGLNAGDQWVKCDESTMCNGVVLPKLQHPGADGDGSPHYAATVTPVVLVVSEEGHPIGWFADKDVRLVTTYAMEGNSCLSQITFEVPSESAAARWLYLPPNKNQSESRTWIRRPSQSPWKLCDDLVNHLTNACDSMQVVFESVHQQDAGDQATGMWFNCRNNVYGIVSIGDTGATCRVQLEYKP
jgi:hypothetical protein